ncbi:MAG: hypothetical protein O7C72_02535, partial [Deltaproteobacteria bacterium]|nr:hypothetical protein [Deltaproteobacteria bacterium]
FKCRPSFVRRESLCEPSPGIGEGSLRQAGISPGAGSQRLGPIAGAGRKGLVGYVPRWITPNFPNVGISTGADGVPVDLWYGCPPLALSVLLNRLTQGSIGTGFTTVHFGLVSFILAPKICPQDKKVIRINRFHRCHHGSYPRCRGFESPHRHQNLLSLVAGIRGPHCAG